MWPALCPQGPGTAGKCRLRRDSNCWSRDSPSAPVGSVRSPDPLLVTGADSALQPQEAHPVPSLQRAPSRQRRGPSLTTWCGSSEGCCQRGQGWEPGAPRGAWGPATQEEGWKTLGSPLKPRKGCPRGQDTPRTGPPRAAAELSGHVAARPRAELPEARRSARNGQLRQEDAGHS